MRYWWRGGVRPRLALKRGFEDVTPCAWRPNDLAGDQHQASRTDIMSAVHRFREVSKREIGNIPRELLLHQHFLDDRQVDRILPDAFMIERHHVGQATRVDRADVRANALIGKALGVVKVKICQEDTSCLDGRRRDAFARRSHIMAEDARTGLGICHDLKDVKHVYVAEHVVALIEQEDTVRIGAQRFGQRGCGTDA